MEPRICSRPPRNQVVTETSVVFFDNDYEILPGANMSEKKT